MTAPNTGWLCPSCGRGVAPTEKTCDHGRGDLGSTVAPYLKLGSRPHRRAIKGACPACEHSGLCMCVNPPGGMGITC